MGEQIQTEERDSILKLIDSHYENSITQSVDKEKYFEILKYIHGIKELEKEGEGILFSFKGIDGKGRIYFSNFPGFKRKKIVCDKNIKLSKDNELNKRLYDGLVSRLNE